ncbi:LysR family transcriptional regulator, partial [filamentous cyanobacterium CCP1]
ECSFMIASSDYTSFVVMPKFLAFCKEAAPNINIRLIGFEKDAVGELLEQGEVDLAIGVFPVPPQQTCHKTLFQERFVGIARKGHPALSSEPLTLETFAALPHALTTIRRDEIGFIDRILSAHNLKRRIAVTAPHMLLLPSLIASSDLIASVPYRIATHVKHFGTLQQFELPIETHPWTVTMLWSRLVDKDSANTWLRQTLRKVCADLDRDATNNSSQNFLT